MLIGAIPVVCVCVRVHERCWECAGSEGGHGAVVLCLARYCLTSVHSALQERRIRDAAVAVEVLRDTMKRASPSLTTEVAAAATATSAVASAVGPCCAFLAAVADGCHWKYAGNKAHRNAVVCCDGAIRVVLAVMMWQADSLAVQQAGCGAVTHVLDTVSRCAPVLVAAGAVPAFARALLLYDSSQGDSVCAVLEALLKLIHCDAGVLALCDDGRAGVRAVVAAMQSCESDGEVQRVGCELLLRVSSGPVGRKCVLLAGGLTAAETALSNSKLDKDHWALAARLASQVRSLPAALFTAV